METGCLGLRLGVEVNVLFSLICLICWLMMPMRETEGQIDLCVRRKRGRVCFMCTHPSCDSEKRFRIKGMDGDKDNNVSSFWRYRRQKVGGIPKEIWLHSHQQRRMVVKSSVTQRSRHGGWGYLEKRKHEGSNSAAVDESRTGRARSQRRHSE